MKRVLLTGISGSIGIHTLSQIMKNTDWEVVGTDSFRHRGFSDRLNQHFKVHPEDQKRVTVITHDLTAPFSEMTRKKIGHIDYIINMASLSDVQASIDNPAPFIFNNVSLALNVLEYARDIWGLRDGNTTPPDGAAFIQVSTDEVYGAVASDSPGHKEWDAINPSNPYSASKAAQEVIAISYWKSFGVPLIITNTMNNFGEMQSATKFPVLVQKALMKGETMKIHGSKSGELGSRFYIHSQSFANALIFLLKNCPPYRHVPEKVDRPDRYNISGDKKLNNLELGQLIAQLMGKEFKYEIINFHSTNPGHDLHYGLDSAKLRALGWKNPVSFEDAMKNVIEWQMQNPEWIV